MWNAAELDGLLIPQRRLLDLTVLEVLNYCYARLVEGLDAKGRRKLWDTLMGKIGPKGGYIIDDPMLPKALQGQEAPSWWDPYHDPWAKPVSRHDVTVN